MPHALYYDVPGNELIYERVKTEIGDSRPDGLLLHMVIKQGSCLRHINVWESKDQFERFQAERVGPAVAKVLEEMGFHERPAPPQLQEMELIDFTTALIPAR
jgi:hypothetical protein